MLKVSGILIELVADWAGSCRTVDYSYGSRALGDRAAAGVVSR